MNNTVIKNAMMITVGHKDWSFPKHIILETDGKRGEGLDIIAKRAFEKYKKSQQKENIYLVTYNNYGDVEIFDNKSKIRKEYHVIQNKEGKFFRCDNISGGYPCFIDGFEFCEKYNSKEFAENFLNSKYATELFKKEFDGCIVKTVIMTVE